MTTIGKKRLEFCTTGLAGWAVAVADREIVDVRGRTEMKVKSKKNVLILALLLSGAVRGAELKPETARAWEHYLAQANAQMEDRTHHQFLWVDESKERWQRVRAGEIVIAPIQPKMPLTITHGLVHHWIGAAFIPGAHVKDVIAKIRDYDRYSEFYAPAVSEAQSIERDPNPDQPHDRFLLTLVNQSLFSKRAIESDNTSNYVSVDARRWYVVSRSIRIQEWAEYGSSGQHKLLAGEGSGYLWSVSSILRLQERDRGVYVEVEAIALSRDVPMTLRFVADPVIRRVSKSTLMTSLDQTRKAVERKAEMASVKYQGIER